VVGDLVNPASGMKQMDLGSSAGWLKASFILLRVIIEPRTTVVRCSRLTFFVIGIDKWRITCNF